MDFTTGETQCPDDPLPSPDHLLPAQFVQVWTCLYLWLKPGAQILRVIRRGNVTACRVQCYLMTTVATSPVAHTYHDELTNVRAVRW